MRVGISVLTHEGQNVWENGLGQNVIFLAQLLQEIHFVNSVVLIDAGDQASMPPQIEAAGLNFQRMRAHEASDLVDVIIEMAGALDTGWLSLMRARGKKVVFYCCGQPYAALIENAIFDKPGSFHRPDRCDEIWVLPEYAEFSAMQRVLHRCEVLVVPYLWQPQFVRQRTEEVDRLTGLRYGYKQRRNERGEKSGFRVAIFEPNISVAKTSVISMLACDEAYRSDPGVVAGLHVLNTLHMTTHPTLLYLANSLDLVRQSKTVFLGRHDIVGHMVEHADAVVSHQWINDQNYSYLDALYGDYPLIHNSLWLKELCGAGYYYPGFDAAEGGRQLRLAFECHELNLEDYRARARKVFETVDPMSPANIAAYGELLTNLCRGTSYEVTA